jgi:beta-lactamase class D
MRLMIILCLFALSFSSCSNNNVTIDGSLQTIFDSNKVTGSFGLFDNTTGEFTVYNMPRFKDSAFTPASTFKILNTLIGLETGRIASDSTLCPWDGITRSNADWNKDMNYYEAFRASCVPCYQQLARRIGKDTMQFWIDTLFKKKIKISGPIDSFWLDNSFQLTGDQQMGVVKKLYFDQLPFQKRSMRIVRNMMLFESKDTYQLSYKTGWGMARNGNELGWIIGWIEENKHPYFFVLNIETPDKNIDMRAVRRRMLQAIFAKLGFMQGKK